MVVGGVVMGGNNRLTKNGFVAFNIKAMISCSSMLGSY